MKPLEVEVGGIFETRNSGQLEVLYFTNSKKVEVKFLETGYMTTTTSQNLRLGNVRDLLRPNIYGIGYFGVGESGKKPLYDSKQYNVWNGMIRRCYCKKQQVRNPTYTGCSVCVEWHNFQTFSKWFEENYIEGYQLDKDTKVDGNKIYSPTTCLFISKEDNARHSANKRWSR